MHNVLAAQDSQYQSLHQLQIQHLRMIITQFDKLVLSFSLRLKMLIKNKYILRLKDILLTFGQIFWRCILGPCVKNFLSTPAFTVWSIFAIPDGRNKHSVAFFQDVETWHIDTTVTTKHLMAVQTFNQEAGSWHECGYLWLDTLYMYNEQKTISIIFFHDFYLPMCKF